VERAQELGPLGGGNNGDVLEVVVQPQLHLLGVAEVVKEFPKDRAS
jgi:hypothetical protein